MFVAARADVVVGIPLFGETKFFFSRLCTFGFFPGGSDFFFARLSRLLYSERYLPPPFPLLGFMSVPEDGEKSSMPSPFFPFVSLKLELDACLPGGEEAGGA